MFLGIVSMCCVTCFLVAPNQCLACFAIFGAIIQVGIYAFFIPALDYRVHTEIENNQNLIDGYQAMSVVNGCSDDYTTIDVAANTLAVE